MCAGWRDGFPEWAEPQQWTDDFLQRYEDCKAEDSLASTAQEQVGFEVKHGHLRASQVSSSSFIYGCCESDCHFSTSTCMSHL